MKTPIFSMLVLSALSLTTFAAEAPKAVATQLTTLLDATQNNDIEKFESVCDEKMQEAMTPEVLTTVSTQLADLMKKGYKTEFMGSTDRILTVTHYWKIDFDADKVPDQLIELSVTDGKVAGFFIR